PVRAEQRAKHHGRHADHHGDKDEQQNRKVLGQHVLLDPPFTAIGWCPRADSNCYGVLGHQPLKLACLPISPRGPQFPALTFGLSLKITDGRPSLSNLAPALSGLPRPACPAPVFRALFLRAATSSLPGRRPP